MGRLPVLDKDALRRRIIALIESELAAVGYELLDVRLFTGGGRLHVRVFLDREGGIDLDGCVAAGRTIGMLLEEAAFLGEAYVIEASSPGVRRPLRLPAHFAAVIGQRIELRVGRGRQTTRRGVLLEVGPEGLRLRAEAASGGADRGRRGSGCGRGQPRRDTGRDAGRAADAPAAVETRPEETEFTVAVGRPRRGEPRSRFRHAGADQRRPAASAGRAQDAAEPGQGGAGGAHGATPASQGGVGRRGRTVRGARQFYGSGARWITMSSTPWR